MTIKFKQNLQYQSGRIKKMIKSAEQEGYKDPMSALWQIVCQNIIHISVLTHQTLKIFVSIYYKIKDLYINTLATAKIHTKRLKTRVEATI